MSQVARLLGTKVGYRKSHGPGKVILGAIAMKRHHARRFGK
jgi:hypothetical protein